MDTLERDAYAQALALFAERDPMLHAASASLPPTWRLQLASIMACTRYADDRVDDTSLSLSERRRALEAWQAELIAETPDSSLIRAYRLTAESLHIAPDGMLDYLRGLRHDLDADGQGFVDIAARDRYIAQVAVAPGLMMLAVLRPSEQGRATEAMRALSTAYQLADIVQDYEEDRDAGRCYLIQGQDRRALHSLVAEALHHFEKARELHALVAPEASAWVRTGMSALAMRLASLR